MALGVLTGVLGVDTFDLEVKLVFLIGNLIISVGNIIAFKVFTNNLFYLSPLGPDHE